MERMVPRDITDLVVDTARKHGIKVDHYTAQHIALAVIDAYRIRLVANKQ